jgi:hypothetical protein
MYYIESALAPASTLKGAPAASAVLAESLDRQSSDSVAGDQAIQLEQLHEAANRSQTRMSNNLL